MYEYFTAEIIVQTITFMDFAVFMIVYLSLCIHIKFTYFLHLVQNAIGTVPKV